MRVGLGMLFQDQVIYSTGKITLNDLTKYLPLSLIFSLDRNASQDLLIEAVDLTDL